ncbi:D-alanine--D-alanine ligase [Mariniphaga sp.]|uniref:D-alanine--D-alanine ligase n=1 Tax=Mariniphaga sp. TaxID=1954475 RepID=UPI0035697496
MTKKPNIAVIAGGDSSEFVVSVKSGANVLAAIDTQKFKPWLVQMRGNEWFVLQGEKQIAAVDKSDFSFSLNNEKIQFEFAYITIHGTPGEDGILQGFFDLLNIPYSTSNVHSSSLTFNKWFCNNYLKSFGIKMARSVKINKGGNVNSSEIIKKLGLPLFVKPNAGGSSFGITKVKNENDLLPAIESAWKESNEALVEEFIAGTEFTCGLVKIGGKKIIFPVTEVIPKNEFFDFEAKYTPGATDEITPARLPEDLYEQCQQLSSEIYDLCQCSGIVRIDFILKNKEFYFLEVNTTPGMTSTSFIPQQINAMGLSLTEIITKVIEDKLDTHQ